MNITCSMACRPLHDNTTSTDKEAMNFYQRIVIQAINEIANDDNYKYRSYLVLQRMLADRDCKHLHFRLKQVVDAAEKAAPNNVREIAEKTIIGVKENVDEAYAAAWTKARAAHLAAYRKALYQGMDSLVKQLG